VTPETPPAPNRPALSRVAIVITARRIADAEGLTELTLRRVAAELETGQASLYRHIANRAELLALLAEDLADSFPIVGPAPATEPLDAVTAQWLAMYDYLAAHPWAAKVIAEGHYLATGARPVVGHGLALLRAAGLDEADAARAYRALWHLVLGHLLNEHPFGAHDHGNAETPPTAPGRTPAPNPAPHRPATNRTGPAASVPAATGLCDPNDGGGRAGAGAEFEWALRRLVTGVGTMGTWHR
jgi:AcrR family transcriptional regulator